MAEIEFELFNNQLLQQMVGPNDSNLKVIEETLNVEIGTFGNHINIKGSGKNGIKRHSNQVARSNKKLVY